MYIVTHVVILFMIYTKSMTRNCTSKLKIKEKVPIVSFIEFNIQKLEIEKTIIYDLHSTIKTRASKMKATSTRQQRWDRREIGVSMTTLRPTQSYMEARWKMTSYTHDDGCDPILNVIFNLSMREILRREVRACWCEEEEEEIEGRYEEEEIEGRYSCCFFSFFVCYMEYN